MAKESVDEQFIVDYLLGALPNDEIERLDELSVSDDDFAEQLDIVENYLVDAYVRGKIPADVIDQFKSHYLTSPKHKEKVAFAETFIRFADKAEIKVPAQITRKQYSGFALQWGLAAAVLVMLAAAGYLLRENMVMRDRVAKIQIERDLQQQREQELQQQVSNQKSVDAETRNELSRVRERLLRVEKELASQEQPVAEEYDLRAVKIIALNLSAQTRAGKIQLLSLPPQLDFVAVNLQIETTDFPEYQVALKDLDVEKTLWQSRKLAPIGKTIQFVMPAKLLEEQNYIFELSGISDDQVPEIISGFPFRVVMQ